MADMTLDVWLYGNLARYGGDAAQSSFANVHACLPEGSIYGGPVILPGNAN